MKEAGPAHQPLLYGIYKLGNEISTKSFNLWSKTVRSTHGTTELYQPFGSVEVKFKENNSKGRKRS